jgi:hypothetical protein
MNPDEAEKRVLAGAAVSREDVARAKTWLLAGDGGRTHELVERWLSEHNLRSDPRHVIDLSSPGVGDAVDSYARATSLERALYQAQWELIGCAELLPTGNTIAAGFTLSYRYPGGGAGLKFLTLGCPCPDGVHRPPLAPTPTADPDVFLKGVDCASLHDGIREAVAQALVCHRRGLYMPATVMLAAAAEATWTECGIAVAAMLKSKALDGVVSDPFASISKKVLETQRALLSGDGKALLKAAGRSTADVDYAVVWTTNLRERRNALHWGKAKSFIADHSETASLLMGAPLYIGTLESIRRAC